MQQTLEGIRRRIESVDRLRAQSGGVLRLREIAALLCLRQHGGMTPGDAARALGLSAASATRCISRLEQFGLVQGRTHASDLRKVVYRLTNRGENVAFECVRACGPVFENLVVRQYAAFNYAVREAGKTAGGTLGPTAGWVLVALCASDCPQPVKAIQRGTALAQSRVSMSLATLRKRGLVELRGECIDARQNMYSLTDLGRETAAVMLAALVRTN